jgi:hypothetical protein
MLRVPFLPVYVFTCAPGFRIAYSILQDGFCIQQCRAVDGVFVFAVELHGIVIVGGRDEQCKAVESEQTFTWRFAIRGRGFGEHRKGRRLHCAQPKFGAQDAAQAGGVGDSAS